MVVVVALSAGGLGFMLVFLWALLHESKRRQPFYALLLEIPHPREVPRLRQTTQRRAAAAGMR